MIVMDQPTTYPGSSRRWSHIMSDLPGEAGRRELDDFARRVGLRPEWLQHPGEPSEHFDTYGRRLEACRRAGAKLVPTIELGRIIHRKRAGVPIPTEE